MRQVVFFFSFSPGLGRPGTAALDQSFYLCLVFWGEEEDEARESRLAEVRRDRDLPLLLPLGTERQVGPAVERSSITTCDTERALPMQKRAPSPGLMIVGNGKNLRNKIRKKENVKEQERKDKNTVKVTNIGKQVSHIGDTFGQRGVQDPATLNILVEKDLVSIPVHIWKLRSISRIAFLRPYHLLNKTDLCSEKKETYLG